MNSSGVRCEAQVGLLQIGRKKKRKGSLTFCGVPGVSGSPCADQHKDTPNAILCSSPVVLSSFRLISSSYCITTPKRPFLEKQD